MVNRKFLMNGLIRPDLLSAGPCSEKIWGPFQCTVDEQIRLADKSLLERLGDLRLNAQTGHNCPSTEFQICRHVFSLCRHERACRHVKLGPG